MKDNSETTNLQNGHEYTKPMIEKCENIIKLRVRQSAAAAGPFFSTLSVGMTSGFSAVLLPQLMKNDSEIKITEEQGSWIASIAVLPMAIGCIISGLMMERFGRRITQRIANLLFFLGWIVVYSSDTLETLCIGRFLTGLCVGLFSPLCLVYIAETSDPLIRGVMLAIIPMATATGILLSHLLGTFLFWKSAALICCAFPLIGFGITLFAPESPSWLMLKGHLKEGEQTFRNLRGYSKESSEELQSMIQQNKNLNSQNNLGHAEKLTLKKLLTPSFLKPLLVMFCFFFIQQFSGVNAVIFYSVTVFSSITTTVNEYLITIVIDVIRVLMSVLACILLKKFNRRTLAVFSTFTTGVSLLSFTIAYKLATKENSWISLPFIIAYICFTNLGTVPLPWILTGEVFPRHIREIGSGCCTCFGFLMFFSVVKSSPFLFATFGAGNTFLIFALVALCGSVFIYFFLPETKNMTLHNIENNLTHKEIVKQQPDDSA